MPPENRDPAYIWDMLEAAQAVVRFTSGVSAESYRSNPMLWRAVEREVEIIGEAARRVSESF